MVKVAVVGCSFRFPGTSQGTYWDDLLDGRDMVSSVDPTRWAVDTFRHPRKAHGGTSYTFASGSLGDVSGFDADFFGISPREAAQMDPQQRLLLEMTWEAFENAGIKPSTVRGSNCGVYIGIASADYSMGFVDDLGAVDANVATGNTASIAANRISYIFDLNGPSMAIDTACSSSLVAFHQACQAILSGECTTALAGGVSLHLHPFGFVAFSKASMLSRKGICNVFDASGDGYVRSEGGGIFLLKDYEAALADGDPIIALVAGTSVNNDGKKSGLTIPNKQAQANLLTEAYAKAGIDIKDISYLEAHGTGTPVGDPIEASALASALGLYRDKNHPLLIGSIKSNLGHLEAASGVAGMVKALYSVQHRTVPATIHLKTPNPNIPFADWNLKVVTQTTALPATGRIVVGVNSFGFGGTNAHVILESPAVKVSAIRPRQTKKAAQTGLPLVVSGRSAAALKASALSLAQFLRSKPEADFYDIAYNTIFCRDWHAHRAVVLGGTPRAVTSALENFALEKPVSLPIASATSLASTVTVAFIYSGNGSQWEGMGRRLLREDAVFKSAVQAVEAELEKYADFSLIDELNAKNGPNRFERTEIAQPALFAIQVGVTEMLRAQGLIPSAVTGHSVGEVAAAWAAGILTLEQAVRVIYYRSHFQGSTKGRGQMCAVALPVEQVRSLLQEAGQQDAIAIAGINSARGVTLAGPTDALQQFEMLLAEHKATFKRLELDYAFHSAAMDPIQSGIEQSLATLVPHKGQVSFVSTVTGKLACGTCLDAEYWWHNIRQPVLFESAVAAVRQLGIDVLIEVGPHAVLRSYLNECLKSEPRPGRTLTTLMRGDDDPEKVWSAAAQSMLSGVKLDLSGYFPKTGAFIALPNYPWQRERHWKTATPDSGNHLQRHKVHPLLGYPLAQQAFSWENQLDTQLHPDLADHVVGEAIVFPGTGFVELGLAVAAQWTGGDKLPEQLDLEELEIKMPLMLSNDSTKLLRVMLDDADGSFTITARDQFSTDAWTLHANGRVLTQPMSVLFESETLQLPERAPDFDAVMHTRLVQRIGLHYGPAFQAVDAGWTDGNTVWTRLNAPSCIAALLPQHLLSPALLDCSFQSLIHLLRDQVELQPGLAYVPVKIGRLSLLTGQSVPAFAKGQLVRKSPHSLTAHFTLFDAQGQVVAFLRDLRLRSVPLGKEATAPLRLIKYEAVPKAHPQIAPTAPQALGAQASLCLAASAQQLCADAANHVYSQQVGPLLDALCVSYAAETIAALADSGGLLTEQRVVALVQNNPTAATMLERLISLLLADQVLETNAMGWQLLDTSGVPASADIWNLLVADHPEYFALINAVGRVGLHMLDLLNGHVTLPELFPKDFSFATMATQTFGLAARYQIHQALTTLALTTLTAQTEGQRLHIVEISSSPPTFVADLLHHLPLDRCELSYATSSRESLDVCQLNHEHWAVLNINDLKAPGFSEAHGRRAQMVLVFNDFASPEEAQLALLAATAALANGGILVWLGLPAMRWVDLIFGAPHSMAATCAQWQEQLLSCGLDVQAPIFFSTDPHAAAFALVCRSAVKQTLPTEIPVATGSLWLVLADARPVVQQLAHQLAEGLRQHGAVVVVAGLTTADPADIGQQLDAIAARHGIPAHVIHLDGLSDAAANPDPDEQFAQQIRRTALSTALVQNYERLQTPATCWLVTVGAATRLIPQRRTHWHDTVDAPLYGLGRTLLNEPGYLSVRLIDLEPSAGADQFSSAMVNSLLHELTCPDAEREVIFSATGERFAPRLRIEAPQHQPQDPLARINLSVFLPGQLRHLRWQAAAALPLLPHEIGIDVAATGLNFRDVMYALGMLSDEAVESGFAGPTLGLECSGVVRAVGTEVTQFKPGDRVLTSGSACFGNQVTVHATAAAHIPEHISFEAAATIPSTFFTAYYAMHYLARLRPGERILIHGAAGGVGIAAIQLAKHLGAEVFATAGSDEKRDFLQLLGVQHIFDSRSLAFADQIMAATQGQGIDVVLNSLAGEAINRNLSLLKPFGRFLELGKRDFYENTKIGLRPFRNNITYFGIDADQLMKEQPALTETLFKEVMALFEQGHLHPLPLQTFEADEVVDAFRHMQQARQIGKIVVTYRRGIHHVHQTLQHWPELVLDPNASYLVTGGLGGFGLKTAQWLVQKGARHLVLVSRSGATTPEAVAVVTHLQTQGVQVLAWSCDVSDGAALQALFNHLATHLPPLKGVVHAAVVIDDALARNTSADQLRKVLAAKILGARHLHDLTQSMPLDFFILYSSATTLFGNPGQAAYVAANAYLESLAEARRSAGLPALCVRWGAIEDVGFLARNEKIKDALQSRMGGGTILSDDALNVLETLLMSDSSDLGVLALDWKALSRFLPSASEPKFSDIASKGHDGESADENAHDIQYLLESLSPAELISTFTDLLKAEVGEILRLSPEKIDPDRSVYDMGLDSLMGVELALAVEARFGVQLTVMSLSETSTIRKMADKIIAQLTKTHVNLDEPPANVLLAAQIQQTARQHGLEVDTGSVSLFADSLQSQQEAAPQRIRQ